MAIGTTAAIIGGLAAAGGAAKGIFGGIQAGKARKAIANYERQDLTNPMENMRISTLGSDLQREQSAQSQANILDVIRSGGSRAIIGATGRAASEFNSLNKDIAVGLDNQMLNRENAVAQGEFRTMQMQERREEADLAGLGQQLNAGQQNMWSGIDDVVSAGMFSANNLESNEGSGDQGYGFNNRNLNKATQLNPSNYGSAYNNVGYYGLT